MVQFLDERVYWADTSLVTAVRADPGNAFLFHLYPNPVLRSGRLTLLTNLPYTGHRLSVIDLNGRIMEVKEGAGDRIEFDAPHQPGWYFFQLENKFSIFRKPFLVL